MTETLIISDGEVWIDALIGDHREVEVVSLHRLVRIDSAEQLNDLRHTKTHYTGNMSNTSAAHTQQNALEGLRHRVYPSYFLSQKYDTESHPAGNNIMYVLWKLSAVQQSLDSL